MIPSDTQTLIIQILICYRIKNYFQDHGDEKEIELLRRMEAELYILSEESSLMNERNLKFIKM